MCRTDGRVSPGCWRTAPVRTTLPVDSRSVGRKVCGGNGSGFRSRAKVTERSTWLSGPAGCPLDMRPADSSWLVPCNVGTTRTCTSRPRATRSRSGRHPGTRVSCGSRPRTARSRPTLTGLVVLDRPNPLCPPQSTTPDPPRTHREAPRLRAADVAPAALAVDLDLARPPGRAGRPQTSGSRSERLALTNRSGADRLPCCSWTTTNWCGSTDPGHRARRMTSHGS